VNWAEGAASSRVDRCREQQESEIVGGLGFAVIKARRERAKGAALCSAEADAHHR